MTLTRMGIKIPENVRGILYICNLTEEGLDVCGESFYTSQYEALQAYGNIPNPESQVMTGKTYEELIQEVEEKHKLMDNPEWVHELRNCI